MNKTLFISIQDNDIDEVRKIIKEKKGSFDYCDHLPTRTALNLNHTEIVKLLFNYDIDYSADFFTYAFNKTIENDNMELLDIIFNKNSKLKEEEILSILINNKNINSFKLLKDKVNIKSIKFDQLYYITYVTKHKNIPLLSFIYQYGSIKEEVEKSHIYKELHKYNLIKKLENF